MDDPEAVDGLRYLASGWKCMQFWHVHAAIYYLSLMHCVALQPITQFMEPCSLNLVQLHSNVSLFVLKENCDSEVGVLHNASPSTSIPAIDPYWALKAKVEATHQSE